MSNRISEQYFSDNPFVDRIDAAATEVCRATEFTIEAEIFRGVLFQSTRVRSVVYRGRWKNKRAALKLQGQPLEVDEGTMNRQFMAQNTSKHIRVPNVWLDEPYDQTRGYGYLITEWIDGRPIFALPFAHAQQMAEFGRMYQEYRTKALTKPWFANDQPSSRAFVTARIAHWEKIRGDQGETDPVEYRPYLADFHERVLPRLDDVPMEFMHGHLTANDVLTTGPDQWVFLSNIFWSYRPKYYDLAFNIWACLQHIRQPGYSLAAMRHYVADWLRHYRTIPVLKADQNFDQTMTMMLLERLIGSLVIDFVRDYGDGMEQTPYRHHLLKLHQQLFMELLASLG